MSESGLLDLLSQLLVSQITTKVVLVVSAGGIGLLLRKFALERKILLKELEVQIKLLRYEIEATDYALEKSFGNGYKDYRKSKLEDLIRDDNFLKQTG